MSDQAARPDRIELIARGVMRAGSRVLLCRNAKHGYFYLPGGHVEPGESAAEALSREFLEETGLSVRPTHCLLVLEHRFTQRGKPRHEVCVMFHVEHPQADEPPVIESREPDIGFAWVEIDRLGEVDIRPEAIRAWLVKLASGTSETEIWISLSESGSRAR